MNMRMETMLEKKENVLPEEKRPQYCDLILLENCMLRCKMCHMWRCEKEIDLVPVPYHKRFIDSLHRYFGSDMQILFVGGEQIGRAHV